MSLAMLMSVSFSVDVFSFTEAELDKYKKNVIMAPDFTLKDLDGNTHNLMAYRGKKVVVLETGSST